MFYSPGCTGTAPANGFVYSADESSVLHGNTIMFTCNAGYKLSSGTGVLTCRTGNLGTVPTCDVGMYCHLVQIV